MRFHAQSEGFVFFVPVRGMSCIWALKFVPTNAPFCYRPREGYELHHEELKGVANALKYSYRPREGYELHRKNCSCWKSVFVIVPVRGMSCIGKSKQT